MADGWLYVIRCECAAEGEDKGRQDPAMGGALPEAALGVAAPLGAASWEAQLGASGESPSVGGPQGAGEPIPTIQEAVIVPARLCAEIHKGF